MTFSDKIEKKTNNNHPTKKIKIKTPHPTTTRPPITQVTIKNTFEAYSPIFIGPNNSLT